MDAVDLNAVWILAGYEEAVCWISPCQTNSPRRDWFTGDSRKPEIKCPTAERCAGFGVDSCLFSPAALHP